MHLISFYTPFCYYRSAKNVIPQTANMRILAWILTPLSVNHEIPPSYNFLVARLCWHICMYYVVHKNQLEYGHYTHHHSRAAEFGAEISIVAKLFCSHCFSA